MIKDIEKNNENIHINDKEIAILKAHFSGCFKKDGSFDIDRFKEVIKDKIDIVHEGYELKFLGKSYAKLLASLDTTTVITPNIDHNSLPENINSENIYISGDNLDGLKHLLKSYSKSIKCIYIDPPYNTGKDGFVYNDKFNFTNDELQDRLSVDETQAKRILDLTKRNSASHSAWLLFIYCRLLLAKDLLRKDGVIFISIDDNEQANLKLLCDDIFGEDNFAGQIVWQTATDNNPTQIAIEHEYVLCYLRDASTQDQWEINSEKGKVILAKYEELKAQYSDDLDQIQTELRKWIRSQTNGNDLSGVSHYSYIDEKGVYYPGNSANTKPGDYKYDIIHPITKKACSKPDNGYRFPKETFLLAQENGDVLFGEDESNIPRIKKRLDTATQKLKSCYYEDNRATTRKLKDIFDGRLVFNNPKSVNFIKNLLQYVAFENDIVLDFFSGSASTVQAVFEHNIQNKGTNLKFIAIQLPEPLSEKNDSQKESYKFLKNINRPTSLDYIGIERIIRAAKKIKEETQATLFDSELTLDFGFKHFILNEPNQNTLDKCETFDKSSLIADATLLDDFGLETVLTTWLNHDGYGLNPTFERIDLAGYEAFYCKKHLYLIHTGFTQESVEALFERYDTEGIFNPENIVLFGYSFNEWSVTEMLEKNLKILNDSEKNLKINIDVRY